MLKHANLFPKRIKNARGPLFFRCKAGVPLSLKYSGTIKDVLKRTNCMLTKERSLLSQIKTIKRVIMFASATQNSRSSGLHTAYATVNHFISKFWSGEAAGLQYFALVKLKIQKKNCITGSTGFGLREIFLVK
jgi:hypothetical protein